MHLWIPKRHTIIVVPRPLMRRSDPLVRRPYRLERPQSAAAFVSSSNLPNQTGSTFDVDKPAGAANGNWLIAFQMTTLGGGTNPATPTGWTLIDRVGVDTGAHDFAYFQKLVSGDGASYTFNGPGGSPLGNSANVYITCWSGADTPTQYTKNSGSGTTLTANGITTTQNNSYLLAGFAIGANLGGTWNMSPLTELGVIGNVVNRLNAGYVAQAVAGASGNKTASTGNSERWGAMLVAIPPAAAVAKGGTAAMMGV